MTPNLPAVRVVLINTKSSASFIAATAAQHQLDAIVNSHNEDSRNDQHSLQVTKAETPFLWGQDFDIEPDVWDDFDSKYA